MDPPSKTYIYRCCWDGAKKNTSDSSTDCWDTGCIGMALAHPQNNWGFQAMKPPSGYMLNILSGCFAVDVFDWFGGNVGTGNLHGFRIVYVIEMKILLQLHYGQKSANHSGMVVNIGF